MDHSFLQETSKFILIFISYKLYLCILYITIFAKKIKLFILTVIIRNCFVTIGLKVCISCLIGMPYSSVIFLDSTAQNILLLEISKNRGEY